MHAYMSNKWETLMWTDLSVQSSPCYIKLKSKLHQAYKKTQTKLYSEFNYPLQTHFTTVPSP